MSLKGNADSNHILRGKLSGLEKINGLSAYEVAVVNGFVGTEEEWLASLKGEDGKDGVVGKDGADGKDGVDGKDGSSIQSIARTAGNGAPGTTDTYTVTLTDGSTSTFDVYNGADGTGAGDMTATVYDPNGKKTDIYKYVDDAVAAGGGGGGVAGVSSFNGRTGAVTPQNGDYTAAMVGADASGSAASALNDAKTYTDGKIAAIPTPDVSGQIGTHNTNTAAHQDIRNAIPKTPADIGAEVSGAAAQALTDAKAYADSIAGSGGSGVTVHTATIGTTWTEDSSTGVKSQNVAIEGVTAENTATVDHVFTDGTEYADFVEAENQYLTYITNGYAETYDGGVTFHIFGDAPTVSIPIVVEVV